MIKHIKSKIAPVLFGFFVMGFCDLVGIATSYAEKEYALSEPVAGFLPSMVFLWFLVFAVPVGVWMNRLGRKKTVLSSMFITLAALLLGSVPGHAALCYLSFALLGIGNTVLQVSLNPLLTNVVRSDKWTGSLTAGQFIKAVSSFCGPLIAGWASVTLDSWHYMFPVFAVITLLSTLWLMSTSIDETQAGSKTVSFVSAFGLLRDHTIRLFFLGIVVVVGVDVGLNTAAPKILMERCSLSLAEAGWGTSVYFLFRTIGTFTGAFLLAGYPPRPFFIGSMVIAVLTMLDLIFLAHGLPHILAAIALMGLAIANVFPILFSAALQRIPAKANEISGLMIMGVSGGAVIPPLMGWLTVRMGTQTGSLVVILGCVGYLLWCSYRVQGRRS
ncbi:MAG: MFS transporter [Prevotellaceae bacterium]|jgi:fucose permease|nr:MFS transporter [Prevotellaceae bacterium]